jgi:hypothetical protein
VDVLVTKKPDGLLGYTVYWKPTHADLYLHAKSHHHSSQKHAVLTTLINRAKSICDTKSLNAEIRHLREAFRQNGNSGAYFNRTVYHIKKTEKEKLIGWQFYHSSTLLHTESADY